MNGDISKAFCKNSSCKSAALLLMLLALLSACSQKPVCDDPTAVEKMLDLASKGVVADLTAQCADSLYKKIPQIAASCPTQVNGDAPSCATACKDWAQTAVKASASSIETKFAADTIATISCRAAVHFDIDYDGGQEVDAKISYLVAPQDGGLQVALSQ